MKRESGVDGAIMWATVLTGAFGVLMVYDSSAVSAALRNRFDSATFFFERQLIWFIVGTVCMVLASRISQNRLQRFIVPGMIAATGLLGLVLIPGIGHSAGGARRWVRIGWFSVQPGEFMRLMLVLYLAHLFSVKKDKIKNFTEAFLPAVTVTAIVIALLIAQPKIGTALLLMLMTAVMLFIAGIPFYQLFLALTASTPFVYFAFSNVDYVQKRIDAWLYPSEHMQTLGFQVVQSMIAIGSGGIFGAGLGQGRQKMFYLPEAHTDMIFPVIAEELGLVGVYCFLFCLGFLLYRGFHVSAQAQSTFGRLLAAGLTVSIVTPAFLNIMVASGLFPVTGIALPLISYGGTALVTDMTSLGLLSGIGRWSSTNFTGIRNEIC
ncbi:MAG: putative lipid II flippase FtsW [bacterium]